MYYHHFHASLVHDKTLAKQYCIRLCSPFSSGTGHVRVGLSSLTRPLDQSSEAQVIENVLDPLHIILDRISSFSQDVVLKVQ